MGLSVNGQAQQWDSENPAFESVLQDFHGLSALAVDPESKALFMASESPATIYRFDNSLPTGNFSKIELQHPSTKNANLEAMAIHGGRLYLCDEDGDKSNVKTVKGRITRAPRIYSMRLPLTGETSPVDLQKLELDFSVDSSGKSVMSLEGLVVSKTRFFAQDQKPEHATVWFYLLDEWNPGNLATVHIAIANGDKLKRVDSVEFKLEKGERMPELFELDGSLYAILTKLRKTKNRDGTWSENSVDKIVKLDDIHASSEEKFQAGGICDFTEIANRARRHGRSGSFEGAAIIPGEKSLLLVSDNMDGSNKNGQSLLVKLNKANKSYSNGPQRDHRPHGSMGKRTPVKDAHSGATVNRALRGHAKNKSQRVATLKLLVPRDAEVTINGKRSHQILEYRLYYLNCPAPTCLVEVAVNNKGDRRCHQTLVHPGHTKILKWPRDFEPTHCQQESRSKPDQQAEIAVLNAKVAELENRLAVEQAAAKKRGQRQKQRVNQLVKRVRQFQSQAGKLARQLAALQKLHPPAKLKPLPYVEPVWLTSAKNQLIRLSKRASQVLALANSKQQEANDNFTSLDEKVRAATARVAAVAGEVDETEQAIGAVREAIDDAIGKLNAEQGTLQSLRVHADAEADPARKAVIQDLIKATERKILDWLEMRTDEQKKLDALESVLRAYEKQLAQAQAELDKLKKERARADVIRQKAAEFVSLAKAANQAVNRAKGKVSAPYTVQAAVEQSIKEARAKVKKAESLK